MPESVQPIIVKRIKKGGHGHHGGAWKVAFADFVTAMMAFFLLMWLLNSTTIEQRRGISHYFQDPSAIQAAGGASTAVIDLGGGMDVPASSPPPVSKSQEESPEEVQEEELRRRERVRLEAMMDQLGEVLRDGQALAGYRDQLLIDMTSEGLRIQVVDKENRPMFALGSAQIQDHARVILREVVRVINAVPNKISVSGHTDRKPYANRDGYTNWELSADRANAARRELVAAGLAEEKLGRVVGLASSVLYDRQDPFNPMNRRISIIVMNRAAEQELDSGEGGRQAPAAVSTAAPAAPARPNAAIEPRPAPASPPAAPAPPARPPPSPAATARPAAPAAPAARQPERNAAGAAARPG
jgi:chemotaxis protein MotB